MYLLRLVRQLFLLLVNLELGLVQLLLEIVLLAFCTFPDAQLHLQFLVLPLKVVNVDLVHALLSLLRLHHLDLVLLHLGRVLRHLVHGHRDHKVLWKLGCHSCSRCGLLLLLTGIRVLRVLLRGVMHHWGRRVEDHRGGRHLHIGHRLLQLAGSLRGWDRRQLAVLR